MIKNVSIPFFHIIKCDKSEKKNEFISLKIKKKTEELPLIAIFWDHIP